MKIISVHGSLPGNGAEWWRVSNIAKLLESGGHQVHFVIICSKKQYEYFQKEGKPIKNNFSFIVGSKITAHVKLLNMLMRTDYDLIYGNTFIGTFYSLLSKLIFKKPLYYDVHGLISEECLLYGYKGSLRFFLNKVVDYLNFKFSDRIVCVSSKMMIYLNEYKGVPPEKMVYVANGIDLNLFKQVNPEKVENIKHKLGLDNKLVFGYIGNFQKWQGVDNLVKITDKLGEDDVKFLFVGGSEEIIKNNAVFIPNVSKSEVVNYYVICDVFILPRPMHNVTDTAAPTKFAEYTAAGKPVLSTDVGDASELIKRYKCGLIVDDTENLIDGINFFKNLNLSKLRKMGENSRKLAENEFDWGKIAKYLLKSLDQYC